MRNKKYSFFFIMSTVFSLFFVLYFFLFSTYFDQKHLEKKEALLYDVINQANQTIIEKTTNYLMPAILIAETSSDLERANAIDVTNYDKFETYALNVIKPHKQLARFYYARKDGNFIMVYRNEDKSISTKIVNPKTKHTIIKERNSFGKVIETKRVKSDYDPRVRPWFIGAKDTEQRYWTDVYIFFTGKRPGITASFPEYDEQNKFSGVFAVDIELENIASFLKQQIPFDGAKIYIINHKNQVIAEPDNISFKSLPNGDVQPIHVKELPDGALAEAVRVHEVSQSEKFHISFGGRKYVSSIRKFPDYLGKKWKIVILVPQKEIVFSPMNFDVPYFLFFGFAILGIVAISYALSRFFSAPLRYLSKDILRLLYNNIDSKLKPSVIREINHCVDAYKQLKDRLLQKK